MDIPFVVETVVEAGVRVTQVFFLDPESNMIEVMLHRRATSWKQWARIRASVVLILKNTRMW